MSSKKLTPEAVEKLFKTFADDYPIQYVADKVGCGYATVIRYLNAFGVSRQIMGHRKEITDDCLVLAAEMRAQRKKWAEVEARIGFCRPTIQRWMKEPRASA
ncbi:hypothetical protein K5E40_03660 [Pseudomonas baetica]|uniref:hypothetical protein n=1 Tax=Pseudomonas baetica TaxID=674054 RepID=UPI001C8C0E99|nr:hypothetical protein [Pseudomonas baetica]MBX9404771.1 hypothetical protein [Pseudomonas baetica]